MESGLLWQDTRPAAEAITAAISRYMARVGGTPNVCYVHPAMRAPLAEKRDDEVVVAGVQVVASTRILRRHYWLGYEAPAARATASPVQLALELNA